MRSAINLGRVKVVSWDVDGTLYSTGRMRLRLLGLFVREVAGRQAVKAIRELAMLRRFHAKMNTVRAAGGFLHDTTVEMDREELLKTEEAWYGPAIRRAGPRPGIREVLAFFHSKNIPQVVFSDHPVGYKLEALALQDWFISVYEGECLGFLKPSAEGFMRIAAHFEIAAQGILHIGDRVDSDGAAARAAGCQCVILGRDFTSFPRFLEKLRSIAGAAVVPQRRVP